MKAHLMFRDRDFESATEFPSGTEDLERDLDLPRVYSAMAGEDAFLYEVARQGVLSAVADPAAIEYRQQVLTDCLACPDVIREMYALAVEAIGKERKIYIGMFSSSPTTILHRSVEVLQMFVEMLHRLRALSDAQIGRFSSAGLQTLVATLGDQLSDEYFAEIQDHLRALRFRAGLTMSAHLGNGNKGKDYVLRTTAVRRRGIADLFRRASKLSFTLPDRDEAGYRALSELHDRGLNLVADATAQSVDHILSFFVMMRRELGFYVGCLNLYETLRSAGAELTFPHARPCGAELTCTGLYDTALALAKAGPVVGNDLSADGTDLVVITGANQGGKSTLLRSIGLAFVLMQAGMFVSATDFTASVGTGIFTHFKREEDETMRSGKLDEEMARMSTIADHIRPGGILLCNESFASTNEREGSEISRQIIAALRDSHIRVFFVTHLYDLAESLYRQGRDDALFLRAERQSDGHRSFRVLPGEPLPTSFGQDVYRRIFGVAGESIGAAGGVTALSRAAR